MWAPQSVWCYTQMQYWSGGWYWSGSWLFYRSNIVNYISGLTIPKIKANLSSVPWLSSIPGASAFANTGDPFSSSVIGGHSEPKQTGLVGCKYQFNKSIYRLYRYFNLVWFLNPLWYIKGIFCDYYNNFLHTAPLNTAALDRGFLVHLFFLMRRCL